MKLFSWEQLKLTNRLKRIRDHVGVWYKDRWRYERALRSSSKAYLKLANRTEKLEASEDGSGYACLWKYTSKLHAPLIQPNLGQRLLRRCLTETPIIQANQAPVLSRDPQVSVLIGHRGLKRLPLLQETLKCFASQQNIDFECIVIEHDTTVRIRDQLPSWVNYIFAKASDGEPYNRSLTFNFGARHAKGYILLLHDNDMLVPSRYVFEINQRIRQGYNVVNPKRYIFYLSTNHTEMWLKNKCDIISYPPEYIVQNLEAGGSMAITVDAYFDIGGMDEDFVGWGGEDNEFWDRCLTHATWIWGYDPIVHLWHESQPLKKHSNNPNILRYKQAILDPAEVRIQRLRKRLIN